SDVGLRLTLSDALQCLLALMGSQLPRPAEATPRSLARFLPPVRARISSRSNSARPPSTVSISRPCAVVVSAQVSFRLRKPAPALISIRRFEPLPAHLSYFREK